MNEKTEDQLYELPYTERLVTKAEYLEFLAALDAGTCPSCLNEEAYWDEDEECMRCASCDAIW